ncbi:hypothetical protein [Streptomyces typhae]|nr:hypothetical protein [Streptomyces typhae]
MVHEALGIAPQHLARLHPADTVPDTVAWLVVTATRHLDHVHQQLIDAAQNAASTLSRVASGTSPVNSLGVLQNTATQIDILAARRADAIEHLQHALHTYCQVTAPASTPTHPAHRPGKALPPPTSSSASAPRTPRR